MPQDDRQWVLDAAKSVPGVLDAYHLVDPKTGNGVSIAFLAGELGIDTSQVHQPRRSPADDVEMLGALLADLGTPIATQTLAAALAWTPERVRAAAAQLRHELQRLGQTITLSPGDQLGLAPYATCISDEQRAAVRREALTIDDATAEVLLTALRGRRNERSGTNSTTTGASSRRSSSRPARSPKTTAYRRAVNAR